MGADDLAWYRIDDQSSVGAVRRGAQRAAKDIHFPESRAGEVAIAATEITTNLHRHASNGMVVLRVLRDGDRAGIGLVAIDDGPGMASTREAHRDGYSTGGTLGLGLGAIERLSSWSDSWSSPGAGTVLVAEFWIAGPPPPRPSVGALRRPMSGEALCGDAVAERVVDGRIVVLLVDGLGHGSLAATASELAVRAFRQEPYSGAGAAVNRLHHVLASSRGAAVAIADIDPARSSVAFCGIGNVAAWMVDGDVRRGMVSLPGIAGHQIRRIKEFSYESPPNSRVVLHSDGLTAKWSPFPVLTRRDPLLAAAALLRDAGVRHDDASVAVVEATCTS